METVHQSISLIGVFIAAFALLGGLISVWVNTNVRIAKIETTVNIKIASMEMAIASYIKTNTENLHESFAENKEDHRAIGGEVKEIRAIVNQINISIAKLPQ